MALNRSAARRLLTDNEYELFAASLADGIGDLSSKRLQGKITRARKLRDKYKDLLRRQTVALPTRSLRGRSGTANVRTEMKQRLFAEALTRFEKRQAKLDAQDARASRKAAKTEGQALLDRKRAADKAQRGARKRRVSPKAPAKKSGKGSHPVPRSESAREARHAMQLQNSLTKPIQAHVRSRGRRAQARRDSR